jgi:ABC-type Zn uptake system ZnuABC Zn-binding protein ZnuA
MKHLFQAFVGLSFLIAGCSENSALTAPQTPSSKSIIAVTISYTYDAVNVGLYNI